MNQLIVRKATESDYTSIWAILEPVIRAGETYAYPRDLSKQEAYKIWMQNPKQLMWQALMKKLGTYYLKANQMGPGSHVCNCGYIVQKHEARHR